MTHVVKSATNQDGFVREYILKNLTQAQLIELHTKYTSMIQGVRVAMNSTNDRQEHRRLTVTRAKIAANVHKIDGELALRKIRAARNYEQRFIVEARKTLPAEVFTKIHNKTLENAHAKS